MIWPKVHSRTPFTGYNGQPSTTTVKRGMFMTIGGVFAAANVPPGTPGKAKTGDTLMEIATYGTCSGAGAYPVDKFIYQMEGADVDLDTIASGDGLICYVGGEYETDQYNACTSGVNTVLGTHLWLDSAGLLTSGMPAGWTVGLKPIAWVRQLSDFPATNKWYNAGNTSGVDSYRKTLWYVLFNYHDGPMYSEGYTAVARMY